MNVKYLLNYLEKNNTTTYVLTDKQITESVMRLIKVMKLKVIVYYGAPFLKGSI